MDLREYLQTQKAEVEEALRAYIPPQDHYPPQLHQAMHYSLFAGGKRIRPILHLAAVTAVGGNRQSCMPFACALELIHTYSLIHDDLPAMDDDDLRRGRPTNHKVYGEAIAILAGDALLTEAFRLISARPLREALNPAALLWATHELAHAAGSQGMVGGQAVDMISQGQDVDEATLNYMHSRKTGALMRAAIRTGAILSEASSDSLDRLTEFGETLGLAFQIRDDLLNVEGDPERLGKSVGTDASRGKATYPALFGTERAKEYLRKLVEKAVEQISPFDHRADPLREIARYMAERDR